MNKAIPVLLGVLLLAAPSAVQAQFGCMTNADNTLTITNYTGAGGAVIIPTNINGLLVTSVGETAFAGCPALTSVTICGSATNIGYSAFENCVNLTNVSILGSVSSMGFLAFSGCLNLASVTLANCVTSIGQEAFSGCTSLTNVMIPGSVSNIEGFAFADCFALTNATLVNGVASIGEYAFNNCISLTNVIIPGSVTNIGDYAFYNCTSLTGAYFTGNAPPAVGADVFNAASNATAYYLSGTSGWSYTFWDFPAGPPAVLWNPVIQTHDGSFGVQKNQFGFNITNTASTNLTVVVEACANLASPVWTPLQTVTLTNGSFYFSEPLQTNTATRFYGLGLP